MQIEIKRTVGEEVSPLLGLLPQQIIITVKDDEEK